jgi:CBS domain containing-hemolysin-like protein
MSAVELTVRLVAGVFLTLANAFFVTTEFALTRLPQFDEGEFQDNPGLQRAWEMTQELEIYLTGCQLGITTSSILLGIVAEPAVSVVVEPVVGLLPLGAGTTSVVSVVTAVVVINLIHKIWGEQAPTYLGVEKPLVISRYAAPVHYWWTMLMYPFILFGDGIAKKTLALFGVQIRRSWTETDADEEGQESVGSRTELRRRMVALMQGQDITADRRQEIINALAIGERPIEEIMVPRGDVIALSVQAPVEENVQIAADHPHSRFPLVNGSLDRVVGTIYAASLLRDWDALRDGKKTLQDLAASPVVVPAETSISRLIDYLQKREQELAIVEDDDEMVGLITVTDAFEAIAGDVKDPLDGEAVKEFSPAAGA